MAQNGNLAPLAVLHLAATFLMTGIILVIQYVHYPLFDYVPDARFAAFHREHARRISWVVGPLMVLELTSGWGLAILYPGGCWLACAALSSLCFALTGLISVPVHNVLARGYDPAAHRRLVRDNIWRTLAWSAHSALLVAWLTAR